MPGIIPGMKKLLPPFALVIVEVALFLTNYQPGTYFLGWDNLFPEMNFEANIQRSLFAVWEEYRGLGLLDGMSFAANLPHYLFLWLASAVLPLDTLRYFFFFLMHLVGGLGMYLFILKGLGRPRSPALAAALFYMLNLATVQMFYVPYELFAVHFAFLPWLVWFIFRYHDSGSPKDLLLFALLSLAAVPQAHVPTIFLVYLVVVGLVLLFRREIKRSLVILLTIFIVNSFWLLPYGYGVLTGGTKTVIEAKINQMSHYDIYANQKNRGNLVDVITLQGFMLDSWEGGYIMAPWRAHADTVLFKTGAVVSIVLMVIGLTRIIVKRKYEAYPLVLIFALVFFFLANDVPIVGELNDWLRNSFSLIGEGFRFSFTKFSIIFVFAYGVFVAYGLEAISKKVAGIIFIAILGVYALPVWQGNFLFDKARIKIPGEYFQIVDYLNTKPQDARVSLFPQPSYWSWRFHDFGYRGSGFFWYGIPQATTDLAFTPWSRENENYYWEISYALYAKNLPLLEAVLEKYDVQYLLLDGNIINPSSPKALYLDELRELIAASGRIKPAVSFGPVQIYTFLSKKTIKDFVFLTSSLPKVGPAYQWGNLDWGYWENGDYQENREDRGNQGNIFYSYRSLFSGRSQADLEFDVKNLPVSGQPLEIKAEKTLTATDGKTDSISWNFGDWRHDQGYLITIESRNRAGKPLLFWVENLNSRRADLETYLSPNSLPRRQAGQLRTPNYFVLPPMEPDGLGYSLHFDNISVGREKTVNELGKITVAPIDYWGLARRQTAEDRKQKTVFLSDFSVEHPNPAWYRVDLGDMGGLRDMDKTLILSQSYDPGWVGVTVGDMGDVGALGGHTKVNNWANGWGLTGREQIVYLFYWPQLLEFAGFGVLTIFMLGLIIRSGSHSEATSS